MSYVEIKLHVHDECELYHPFDPTRQTLHPDVVDYLYAAYIHEDTRGQRTIHVTSDTPIDKDTLRAAYAKYLDTLHIELQQERQKNLVKQAWMFGIGAAFIGCGLGLGDQLPALLGEIISTIGAFAMWEAASIWIVENPKNRLKKRRIQRLSQTQLRFDT